VQDHSWVAPTSQSIHILAVSIVVGSACMGEVVRWDEGEPPMSAKVAGALSLLLWSGVVFFGRWVGFTT
jgi:hypothetical protein